MERLNVSTGAGGQVTVRRNRFDSHIDHCDQCVRVSLCPTAQSLWRATVMAALRQAQGVQS